VFQTETSPILPPWPFGSHWNVLSDSALGTRRQGDLLLFDENEKKSK